MAKTYATFSSKGQLVIPAAIREQWGSSPEHAWRSTRKEAE